MAVRSGSEEMVKCLLAHETIDINVTNRVSEIVCVFLLQLL